MFHFDHPLMLLYSFGPVDPSYIRIIVVYVIIQKKKKKCGGVLESQPPMRLWGLGLSLMKNEKHILYLYVNLLLLDG
jgi:hypothetical protein